MIHVIATVEVQPGKREAFLAEFHRIMPLVHAEKGCIEYGPAIDLASGITVQDPVRENAVTILEKWESLETLRTHLNAQHMVDYRVRVREFVSQVRLQVLEPA